ncbi:MAG: cytochrome c peroxidase [Planctomycetota bacterium]|jgi:YVTN family beta-propeller protein
MKKVVTGLHLFLVLTAFTSVARAEEYLSPLALAADNDNSRLYIAEFTANKVAIFDLDNEKVTDIISLPASPTGLAISPNKSYLYVTCEAPEGKVYLIDVKNKNITGSISVGHTPNAPVVNPDGRTLYVCNRFNNNISVIDLISKKEMAKITVVREPAAAAITPNGRLLFVTNLLPSGRADVALVAAAVSVIDTRGNNVVATIQLPNGSTGVRDICISPDGQHAYVTHTLAHYQVPTTQVERGWMNTNALSLIDAAKQTLLSTILLDDIHDGAANPWGVVCTPDGKYICVAHSGTHEVSIIDRQGLHKKLAKEKVTYGPLSEPGIINELAFLAGLRRRVRLDGNGPRGLGIVGSKVYVAEYFTDSLGVVDINNAVRPKGKSVALGPSQSRVLTAARQGEMLFHDASLCFQNWQSCATCHPGQGRTDGLNWDLLNDGMGNPRNTKSLLLSHRTPPVMITGMRDKAEEAVRAGLSNIHFIESSEQDAAAIDEYLKSLEPIPSPYLIQGTLSEAAKRGSKIFEKAGCASCHSAPLYTDMNKYDVGTGKDTEKNLAFDTPTLVELWRTGPYLVDGRAATMKEVLTKHNLEDKHGETSSLNEQQINDLAEFILSQ